MKHYLISYAYRKTFQSIWSYNNVISSQASFDSPGGLDRLLSDIRKFENMDLNIGNIAILSAMPLGDNFNTESEDSDGD